MEHVIWYVKYSVDIHPEHYDHGKKKEDTIAH